MSEAIKHECGIVLLRLRKPLQYYIDKYGTATYGLNKLYLLMEKQHNRGQDGVGVATVKFDMPPGEDYITRYRSIETNPIKDVFAKASKKLSKIEKKTPEKLKKAKFLKKRVPAIGELMLGHLRYGTHGENSIKACHPFKRINNWMSKNLVLAGNFNLTNVDELFDELVELGQHPKLRRDTVTVMEKVGHFLESEVEQIASKYKKSGLKNEQINKHIIEEINLQRVLSRASKGFDGGYTMVGMIGHGDAFAFRDAKGIRPAFYYQDDEVVVVASERPAIQTAFNLRKEAVKEIKPGCALIIKKNGETVEEAYAENVEVPSSCSFERIYFSRGTDANIYQERKKLGYLLTPNILKAVNYDMVNTVFSFIPNTAEIAFYGLIDGLNQYLNTHKIDQLKNESLSQEKIQDILRLSPRIEKIAVKDAKLRTFITQDNSRDSLVSHVYDVTYGVIKENIDQLVVIDDSIVRGTTLEKSILSNLGRLCPKKIIVASSAPQIRYPDCYGIDMSKMHEFVAFKAMIALVHEKKKASILETTYQKCKAQEDKPKEQVVNYVKDLYALFTPEQISRKIAQIIKPKHISAEVHVIYQSISNLHKACPSHKGDWYFTGNFPTPGGNKVVNKAFINYMEGKDVRAY